MNPGWTEYTAGPVLDVHPKAALRTVRKALRTVALLELDDPAKTANTRCLIMYELGLIELKPDGPTWFHDYRRAATLLDIGNGKPMRDRQLSYLVKQAIEPAFEKETKLRGADWIKTQMDYMEVLERIAQERFDQNELAKLERMREGRLDKAELRSAGH